MKLLLIISVFTTISAIKVPSVWQQSNQNTNNNVNRDSLPTRQQDTLAQAGPSYNNINPFTNNVPNTAPNGFIPNGNLFENLGTDYDWLNPKVPNNGFVFINPANQINNANLLNINHLANNANEIRRKPYVQPKQSPQFQTNYNRRPSNSVTTPYNEAPGRVPYITYTTQRPASQIAAFNTAPPQAVNIKQAYPRVNNPNTVLPITELDFSPLDPFPHSQQNGQASTQINNLNAPFSTSQPINNLDFSLKNPFSRNPQLNGYQLNQFPQSSRIPINNPFHGIADSRQPVNNPTAVKNLNFNPFTKNYRDHRTHEPTQYDPNYNREAVPKIERLKSERAPTVQNHEYPGDVPTRPIYPGEAQWAKPGAKHRPFVSKQQYSNLEEPNKQPDGYDTFLEAQNLFENQKKQFGLKLQQLPSIDNSPTQQSTKEENTEESEIFVPTRLYAQVRHIEDEKHLPPESDGNGRLKELVKDSKVQTIYSEEGYEDSAYDHAGHEKKAENTEGFESDEKNKEAKEKKKTPVKKYDRQSSSYAIGDQDIKEEDIEKLKKDELNVEDEDEEKEDSEPAGTHYEEQSYLNTIPTKNKNGVKKVDALIRPKEIKTVTAKAKTGENIEMEIASEVKAVPQPNNSTQIHKYVKIYPKIHKNATANVNLIEKENDTLLQRKENKFDAEKRSLTLNPHEIFIEEITNQTNTGITEEFISTTATSTEFREIVTMEIPTTTEATTALSKLEVKNKDISSESLERPEFKLQVRRKRSAVGIPTIEIDTDFIDEINHDIGKPTEKSNAPIEKKYPYYKAYKEKGIHENSPLRYAEDSKNVPRKIDGKLAFYDLADKKMACSEVNPEVDPVPDRIKDADESIEDEEEDESNDPAAKEPRLGKLGDKIDCFKMKYFGEDPLDNPFFQEKVVGPVKPIFSEIENISTKKIGGSDKDAVGKESSFQSIQNGPNTLLNANKEQEQLHAAASNHAIDNEIDGSLPYKSGLRSWFPGKSFGLGENTERDSKYINHFVEKNPNPKVNTDQDAKKLNDDVDKKKSQNLKETPKEVYTIPPLITTPKYTIQLRPKHIYDQIELLEYLPEDEFDEVKKAISAELPKLNITEVTTTSLPITKKTETVLNAPVPKKRKSGKKNGGRKAKVLKNEEESMKMETTDNKKPESFSEVDALQLIRPKPRKPLYEIFDINKFIPKAPIIPKNIKNPISKPNYLAPVSIQNPTYQIFDINKFLPTTPFPLFKDFMTRSTVLPKYKVLSEVFYKEDIKPNEQLNVFTDVLKHIRSFPKLKDSFSESSEPISVKIKSEKISEEFPQNLFGNDKKGLSTTVTTIMSTFEPKVYASNHKYPQAENPLTAEKQIEDMLNEFKTGTKSKRRRRIKTTTQETPVVIEESTSTLQFIGEPTEVMGLMPPIIQGYKTIYHPKRDSSHHISNPTIRIEERKINRYFVQGMRPPPKQKVYLYSDFLTDNHIMQRMSRPKRNKLRRSRRSAQRPAYAQVSRNNNKQPDAETEKKKEEDDDYVPQRSRNYHYDEKTGKIIYDNKPQEQSAEEEEVEYIEVVEETPKTTEKPKQSPVFATATPPPQGQSYTDFVKLLKSASNYKEIPDPTTTEKGAEEVTQKMVASTLEPVSTTAPEFLSILAKVRSDSNYKLIEEKKKTTTTPKSAEEVEEAEAESSDDESQVDNIQNSPGGQGYEAGANLEIFDIAEFLPNVKSYLPKTSIDTSKYKTIERPNVRHSLSNRYNSEEDKNLQNVNTNKEPILSKTERTSTRTKHTKERAQKQSNSIDSKATTPAPEVTSQKIVRLSRRRTTTVSTIESQTDTASSTQATLTADESASVQQDKPRRNYRRRPTRIKIQPAANNSSEAGTEAAKVVRRRAERHSNLDAEGNEKYEQIVDADGSVPSEPIIMEDYVDYEVPDNVNDTSAEQLDNIELVAKKVVDVFKNYNKDQQHGGNYKKEDEVIEAEVASPEKQDKITEPVKDLKTSDKIRKNEKEKENVSKPKEHVKTTIKKTDLKDIKKVEVFKDYDKTKQHGGNYRPANDAINISEQDESGLERNESIQIQNVNVFQDYDKTKKHGGNYKSANATSEEQNAPVLLKKVEVFKDYDKARKHGGNYRSKNDTANLKLENPVQLKNVDVFKNYDKTKKHGGNYRSENDTANVQLENPVLLKNVEVLKDYDKKKKHGGNYRPESEDIEEQQLEESQFGTPQIRQNVLNNESEKKSSVEVFKDYDKIKKHGGNYMRENESVDKTATIEKQQPVDPAKDVEIFKDYDEAKMTGGNYRSENDTANVQLENPVLLRNVEVLKDYDKKKKHGGNYRPESEDIEEQQLEESQFGTSQIRQNVLNDKPEKKSSVEVFKDYDKTKKHGGNYMRENERVDKAKTIEKQQPVDPVKDVEIFKNYDEAKKTGGNYRREDESIEMKADETHISKSKVPAQTKRFVESRNNVQQVAEVVVKPEEIYSDLKLPLDINALKIIKDLPNEELEEIVKSAEDDDGKNNEGPHETATVVTIGNKIKVPSTLEKLVAPTKKPVFIKDPSKRLYFYAPVR